MLLLLFLLNNLNLKRVLFGLIICLSIIASLLTFKMVHVVPATATTQEFSAERAFNHVEAICQDPHPMGSDEIQQVRTYIVDEITSMGITAIIQETTVPDYYSTIYNAEPVSIYNVFAVLQGTNSTGSIVLVGHYDTVPVSPGANDNGSAVATLLETTRSLIAGPPLKNDVILLFTDAEEPGQYRYGARFFAENYELINDIRLVLNFEAVGRTGPSIMFETGPNNESLIQALYQNAANPVAFSFISDFYRFVAKGSTDFVAFEEVGINGLNFAYSFERTIYHTALDNVDSVDKRSLQHHGDYALNLARYFGDLNFDEANSRVERDVVYHSLLYGTSIRYPASWVIPIVILTGILLFLCIYIGLRRRMITKLGVSLSILAFLIEIFVLTLVLTLVWWGMEELHYSLGTVAEPALESPLFLLVFLFFSMTIMIANRIWFAERTNSLSIHVGEMISWWLLAMLAGFYLPGLNIILLWPVFFRLLPLSWIMLRKMENNNSWGYFILISVSSAVSIVLLTVPIYLFFQALGISSPGFSGSPTFPFIGLSIFFWMMLISLLLPNLEFFGNLKRRGVLYGLLAITIACLIAAIVVPGIPVDSFGL